MDGRRTIRIDSLVRFGTMEVCIMPAAPGPVITFLTMHDPLPMPETSPGPYPGDDPPIDHPELPGGPVGPGR